MTSSTSNNSGPSNAPLPPSKKSNTQVSSLPVMPPNLAFNQSLESPQINESDTGPEASTLSERVLQNQHPISSLLISLILHTVLLLILALLTRQLNSNSQTVMEVNIADDVAIEQPQDDLETVDLNLPDEAPTPVENTSTDVSNDEALAAAADENVSIEPPKETLVPSTDNPTSPLGKVLTAPGGGGIKGRQSENRARLARKYGATAASEAAVESGLRWLKIHQNQSDGSWSLQHHRGICNGRCRHPGSVVSPNAATGLALLAFLGAGHTHQSGRYQGEVAFGLSFLKSRINETKFGGSLSDDRMYSHGLATLALCEAYAMTKDPELKEHCEKAIKFIVSAQHAKGGWRYFPGNAGDMSVTGWQLMALKSAQMGGIYVPESTMDKATEFLNATEDSDGAYYSYQPGERKTPTNTAIGLLMRMYLGWPRDKGVMDQGAEWLLSRGVSRTDIYHNYYATQVIHHLRMDGWDEWNTELRDFLVKRQSKRGHEEGSWHFSHRWGQAGGRLYSTALAIMVLEVYYRYLPIYDDDEILN